jgi:hypothetical protein
MIPYNLNLVSQPAWRITLVHWFAQLIGVYIHVEGLPFGSTRIWQRSRQAKTLVGAQGADAAYKTTEKSATH